MLRGKHAAYSKRQRARLLFTVTPSSVVLNSLVIVRRSAEVCHTRLMATPLLRASLLSRVFTYLSPSIFLPLPPSKDEATIYVYKNDVATQPLQRLCVGDCNVSCSVSFCGTCRDGFYCFTVESSDEGGKKTGSNVFCSNDTAEQERWIQALINAGASFTENQNELVKDAHSFYEFKVSHGSGMGSNR